MIELTRFQQLRPVQKIAEEKLDPKKYSAGQIVAVNDKGAVDYSVKIYDISLTIYFLTMNVLYNDAFSIISLTMLGNLLADTYSPNILFMEEKTLSTIHLCP